MQIINSIKMAFAMYSRIPVGNVSMDKDNMRYGFCFVPIVGLIIGIIQCLWYFASVKLGFNNMFFAAIACIIPLIITGGIHMDGYCDVCDAMASCAPKDKKLDILKDPHVGAFAIIWTVVYFMALFGAYTLVLSINVSVIAGLAFVISRAVSCLCAISMKNARKDGMLYGISSIQDAGIVAGSLIFYIIAALSVICIINMVSGVIIFVVTGVTVIYYRHMTYRNFGGVTGDTAGYLVSILELFIVIGAVSGEAVWSLL